MDGRIVIQRISAAAISSVKTPLRAVSTLLISSLLFLILSVNAYATRNFSLLSESLTNIPTVLLNGIGSFQVQGTEMLALVVIYCITAGMAITAFGIQLRSKKLDLKTGAGIIPGFFAAGCGCGIGLLGLIGIGGVVGILPFGGRLALSIGIVFVVFTLYRFGDPNKCGVKVNVGS